MQSKYWDPTIDWCCVCGGEFGDLGVVHVEGLVWVIEVCGVEEARGYHIGVLHVVCPGL